MLDAAPNTQGFAAMSPLPQAPLQCVLVTYVEGGCLFLITLNLGWPTDQYFDLYEAMEVICGTASPGMTKGCQLLSFCS
jgi:hypothetical protein